MTATITLPCLTAGKPSDNITIEICDKTTLDINQVPEQTNINITSTAGGFEFNALYARISKALQADQTCTLTIESERGAGQMLFEGLKASYYLSMHGESLSFNRQNLQESNQD